MGESILINRTSLPPRCKRISSSSRPPRRSTTITNHNGSATHPSDCIAHSSRWSRPPPVLHCPCWHHQQHAIKPGLLPRDDYKRHPRRAQPIKMDSLLHLAVRIRLLPYFARFRCHCTVHGSAGNVHSPRLIPLELQFLRRIGFPGPVRRVDDCLVCPRPQPLPRRRSRCAAWPLRLWLLVGRSRLLLPVHSPILRWRLSRQEQG